MNNNKLHIIHYLFIALFLSVQIPVKSQVDSFDHISQKAGLAYENAHYKKAIDISLKTLKSQNQPKVRIDIHNFLGKCYLKKGKNKKARTQFLKVLKTHPHQTNAKTHLMQLDYQDGRYYSALHYAKDLLITDKTNEDLWLKQARIYQKLERYKESIQTLKSARQHIPDNKKISQTQRRITIEAGENALGKKQNKRALQRFQEAIALDSANTQVYKKLLALYLKYSNQETALKLSNQAISHFPKNRELIKTKLEILRSKEAYQKALKFADRKTTKNNAAELEEIKVAILKQAIKSNSEKHNLSLYKRLYSLEKSNDKAFQYLIHSALKKDRFYKALTIINKRLQENPHSKTLLLKKIQIYKQLKDKTKIKTTALKLSSYYPGDPAVFKQSRSFFFEDAKKYFNTREFDKAIPLFRKLKSDSIYGRSSTNHLYSIYLKRGEIQKASETLNRFGNSHTKTSRYQIRKANLLQAKDKNQEAYHLIDSLSTTHPDEKIYTDFIYENSLPLIQEAIEQKDYDKALVYIDKVLDREPQRKLILKYQTDVFMLTEQFRKAKSSCLKRIQLFPDDEKLKIKLGYIYDKLRKHQKAISIYRKLYQNHPENKTYKKALVHQLNKRGSKELRADHFSKARRSFHEVLTIAPKNTKAVKQTIALLIRKKSYKKALFLAKKNTDKENINNTILLITALLYESENNYNKALLYYGLYKPSFQQKEKLIKHKEQLKRKLLKNRIRVNYRYINSDSLFYASSVASLEYARKFENSTLLLRANYTSRDEEAGFQGEVDLYHSFNEKNNMYASVGIANQFFPKIKAGASYYRAFNKGWQAEVGGRYFYDQIGENNLFFGVLGVEKYIGDFWLNGQLTFRTNKNLKRHFLFRARKYLSNEKNYLTVMGGVGNIPYSNNINYLPREELSFKNYMIGAGFNGQISSKTGFKVLLNWYSYKIPKRGHSNHYHAFVSLFHNF